MPEWTFALDLVGSQELPLPEVSACCPVPDGRNGALNALRTILATAVAAYPAVFLREAACIRAHETSCLGAAQWQALTDCQGHPNGYAGAYQFTLHTWNEAPGRHLLALQDVAHASPAEQTRHAWYIFTVRGGTWRRDWPATSRICGTR